MALTRVIIEMNVDLDYLDELLEEPVDSRKIRILHFATHPDTSSSSIIDGWRKGAKLVTNYVKGKRTHLEQ